MDEIRLIQWMGGQLPDSELTLAEVTWLEEAVFVAVAEKLLAVEQARELQ